jgi:hypothetical protein
MTCADTVYCIKLQLIPQFSRSAAMPISPQTVIDQSIRQLQTLSTILAAEVQQSLLASTQLPVDKLICKEALLTVSVLLPKLQQARCVVDAPNPAPPLRCTSCDE